MFNFSRPVLPNWRSKLEYLKAMREQIKEYGQAVPGLAPILKKQYDEEFELFSPDVQAGAVQEFQGSLTTYRDAAKKRDAAIAKERERWEPVKLAGEIQAVKTLVDGAIHAPDNSFTPGKKAEKLSQLYSDLMVGDIFRQRAAAEVFAEVGDVVRLDGPGADEIRGLAGKAKSKLAELRTIPEMTETENAIPPARSALLAKHEELLKVGQELGVVPQIDRELLREGADPTGGPQIVNPITQAYRSVKEISLNDVQILSPDDPELTGVVFGESMKNYIANGGKD